MIARDAWRKLKISQQITLISTVPMLILYIAIFAFLLNARLNDQETMQHEHGSLLVTQLAVASEFAVLTGNEQQLRSMLQRSVNGPVANITVWDARDRQLVTIGNPNAARNVDVFRSDIRMEPIALDDAASKLEEQQADPKTLSEQVDE